MNKLKTKFESLTAKQKQGVMFGCVAFAVIFLVLIFSEEKKVVQQRVANNDIKLIDEEVNDFTMERLSGENKLLRSKVNNLTDKMNLMDDNYRNLQRSFNLNKEFAETPQVLYETQRELKKVQQELKDMQNGAFNANTNYVRQDSDVDFIDGLIDQNISSEEQVETQTQGIQKSNTPNDASVFEPINDVSKVTVPKDAMDFVKNAHNSAEKNSSDIEQNQYVDEDNNTSEPSLSDESPISISHEVDESSSEENKDIAKEEYEGAILPAGTLIPGIVITGVDAPTGKAADKGAAASTIRINGPAILPNGGRVDLEGCFVVNDVRGDLATERGIYRPQRITCSLDVGIVDTPLQGYVTGKDGTLGFRGKVVNKQGQALFYSATSGFIGGLGSAFGGGNGNQQQMALTTGGAYELPDSDQALTAGASKGISDAAKELADYYNEQLDLLYPIVEIKPMIAGNIHLLQTVRLKLYE